MSGGRWLLVVLVVLILIGLIGFARGREHRRGDELGEQAAVAAAAY